MNANEAASRITEAISGLRLAMNNDKSAVGQARGISN